MESIIYDIYGLLNLVRSGKIEPITLWKYYVSQWNEEEQRIFLLKLIAISKNEKEEGRQESDVDKWASYHASYLSRKINEVRLHLNNEQIDKKKIPDELNTAEAQKWLQVAINSGLLNSNYSTTDKVSTKPQKALLAEILSEKIGLKYKYKLFEILWGVSGLSQQRYKSKYEKGKVKGGEVILKAFGEK